jgi:uncharacterized protein
VIAMPALTARLLLTFHGDTLALLRKKPDSNGTIAYPLSRRASIKDILESLGLPHTEVGRIVLNGQEQTFLKIAEEGEHFEIHPLTLAMPPTIPTLLRPTPLTACIFLVDINVRRLAGLLRMAGIDAEAVDPESTDSANVQRAIDENRILLTRNREILKQSRLVFGRLVRSENPDHQLREIIDFYQLHNQLRPFSRCIACNGLLIEVAKDAIIDHLLPLTKKYYSQFNQCAGCGKIYWHGSHHDKMTAKLNRILDNKQ